MGKSQGLTLDRISVSFKGFLLKDNDNKRLALITFVILLIQFILFKLLYPFPDFFDDSYSYLFAAYAHLDISIWPIGYSKFLALFHKLTWSDTALVAFQYFFLQLACLYLYFTLVYFFRLSIWGRKVLWSFLFVNPLALYLCNLINSDALFAALSVLWITQLVWVIQRPDRWQIAIQAVLLFLCFTVRNNAYYYPLVTIAGFLLSKQGWKAKTIGITLPFLFIIPFVLHTREVAYKMTGARQFSLFSGWQLANNALYTYDQIEVDTTILTTPEARKLNSLAVDYFKRVDKDEYREYLESFVGNYFIKDQNAPLKRYFRHHFKPGNEQGIIRDWGKASAAFEPFGKSIILHHPFAYIRYFMWPNFWHYILPPLSNLEVYDYGINEVDPIAQYWFHYPTKQIHCFSTKLQGYLLFMYTALFCCCNLFMAWKLIGSFFHWYISEPREKTPPVLLVMACFALLNFGFSLASTVDMLRYQYTPMFVITALGLLLSDYQSQLIKAASKKENKHPILGYS